MMIFCSGEKNVILDPPRKGLKDGSKRGEGKKYLGSSLYGGIQ